MFNILNPNLENHSLKRIKDFFVNQKENDGVDLKEILKEESTKSSSTKENLKYRLFCSLLSDFMRVGWTVQSSLQGFALEIPKFSKEESIKLSKQNALEDINNPKSINFIKKLRNPPDELKRKSVDLLVDNGEELEKIFKEINEILDEDKKIIKLKKVFKPELQHCFEDEVCEITNIRLMEIWEFFRLTWSIPYGTANARTMPVLVRNAARPNKPVIGIFQFSQPSFNNTGRNKFLKMDNYLSAFKEVQTKNISINELSEACLNSIEKSIKETRWDDLKLTNSDIKKPSTNIINYLKETSEKFRLEENLEEEEDLVIKKTEKKTVIKAKKKKRTPKELSETKMYLKKRCKRLSKLLFARKVFNDCKLKKDPKRAFTIMIQIKDGQRAINLALEFLRNDIFSTQVLDINVCGAVAPYNEILGGKLITLLASSKEVVEMYDKNYKKYISIISSGVAGREMIKSSKSIFLCTQSLYDQGSSQYNRLKLLKKNFSNLKSDLIWQEAGFTSGLGTDHISSRTTRLCDQIIQKFKKIQKKSESGKGHSAKLTLVTAALKIININPDIALYGNKRKNYVYFPKKANHLTKYVYNLKKIENLNHYNKIDVILDAWMKRWLTKRIQRSETLEKLSNLNYKSVSSIFNKLTG